MFHRDRFAQSHAFRHLSRALQPGERIPPPPSLIAQVVACQAGMERLEDIPETDDEGWEDDLADED